MSGCKRFMVLAIAAVCLGVGATSAHAEKLLVAGGATNPTDSEVTITFEFTKPIALTDTVLMASSMISYTLTDGDKDGQVTLQAVSPNTTLLVASVDDNSMVTHDLGVGSGDDGTFAVGFGGPFTASNASATPKGTYERLDAVVSFVISPHDAFSFSGYVEVTAADVVIPEPASLSLLAVGLASMFQRRRHH